VPGLEVTKQTKRPYVYKSLFDEPLITVTGPGGEKKSAKAEIHPNTSYEGFENVSSGKDSDDEDVGDIRHAQKLSFSMTPILVRDDTPRTIRFIYRGDYQQVVDTSREEQQPLRKYLVATDLSDESTHALEWAIGTVLRDGDTLMCIYCVDEEAGIGLTPPSQSPASTDDINTITEDATVAAAAGSTPPGNDDPVPQIQRAVALAPMADASSRPASRGRTRAEQDRILAVRAITDRVVKLLRKTRLQVRVTVEVLHCKTPKHVITEVIDLINPTLVILGSRGRSALKG
jgi:nucleotide-binding universal stress UspA family protein